MGRACSIVDAVRGCKPAPDARGLLPGLVVGDESGLSETLRSDMQSIGLSHLTAVSGANLAIVTGLVLALARLFGVTRRVAVCCAAAALFGFVVVVGPQPSVLRAAAMGVVGLFAIFSARDRAGFTALTMSIVALLMVDPWMSVSMGFALSVAATAGLLLFARAQRNRESHQSSRWGLSRAKRGSTSRWVLRARLNSRLFRSPPVSATAFRWSVFLQTC